MKKSEIADRILSIIMIVALALVIISGSISVPILFRSFYYIQIEGLGLPEYTGYSHEEIKAAFDEMMDFCVFDKEFGTGVLKWSEEGKSHFADCAVLFRLDLGVLVISSLIVALLIIYVCIFRRSGFHRFKGFPPMFYAGLVPLILFTVIGIACAIDFNRAFTVFHMIFFSGKTNWVFDPNKDEIIKILPETFFMNCGILILAVLICLCVFFVIMGIVRKQNSKKTSK